ncbi:MAG: BLUF domain-containing protein [Gammaproteobacteria bacterium]|nr:BLUF domain-containing protein [Gammaproteobacteria bacterium]
MSLIHCIYCSAASVELDQAARHELLARSQANNARLDITGILLYVEDAFFQVLEGEAEAVDDLFLHIAGDPRHSNVTEIIREPIVARRFPDWSMGYAELSRAEIMATPGLNDFFQDGRCLQALDDGRAKKLLQAFASGRWRQRPSIRTAAAR